MSVLSLPFSPWIMNRSIMPQPIVRIVHVLMWWHGTFGVGIDSVRFLTLGCLANPFASCYSRSQCYITNELEKRRAYDEMVREVERACFSPLVFSASGGMGPSATTVYKKLALMLAEKWNINYGRCVFWLRCWVCFSLLRSTIMCVRGNRSSVRLSSCCG